MNSLKLDAEGVCHCGRCSARREKAKGKYTEGPRPVVGDEFASGLFLAVAVLSVIVVVYQVATF